MFNTRDLVLVALFAAMMAALGLMPPIAVPLIAVPITAQSLGVMLCGAVLGAKRGALAQVLFLILVAAGLPLLAGGRGGIGVFATGSAGFLISWPIAAFVTGWIVEKNWSLLNWWIAGLACVIGGIGIVYLIGIPGITVMADVPLDKAFMGSLAFIPGDLIKAIIATAICLAVKRGYPIIDSKSA